MLSDRMKTCGTIKRNGHLTGNAPTDRSFSLARICVVPIGFGFRPSAFFRVSAFGLRI